MGHFLDLRETQQRQFIDAQTAFDELRRVRQEAARYQGSMFWREVGGRPYLISASPRGAQKSLGARSDETQLIHDRFTSRKAALEQRLRAIKASVADHVRMNRALGVGRVPNIVVKILDALDDAGIAEHFIVVGTHALYAYESAAGVRFDAGALATRDIDLLFDTRKRMAFATQLEHHKASFIGILRQADKSFERLDDQTETARNSDGFEVDVIRRMTTEDDPHPYRLSNAEDDIWAVQANTAGRLINSPRMSQIVAGTGGGMALMHTVRPLHFAAVKRQLAALPNRETLKRRKDVLQAEAVEALVESHLVQFRTEPPPGPATR